MKTFTVFAVENVLAKYHRTTGNFFQKGEKNIAKLPEIRKKLSISKLGPKHPLWKGEHASYGAKHFGIQSILGKASICEVNPFHIAKKYEWANLDHNYTRNPNEYARLCQSCHIAYDRGKIKVRGLLLVERGGNVSTIIRKSAYRSWNKGLIKETNEKLALISKKISDTNTK